MGDDASQEPAVRHAVRARALVAGLAPAVVPMIIEELWTRGMRLAFDGHSSKVDDRWAIVGTGVLVVFKAAAAAEKRRITLHGRLLRRDAGSIELGLLALNSAALAALRSLAAAERGADEVARRPSDAASAQQMTADAVAGSCLAVVRKQLPSLIGAYLDALAESLQGASGADSPSKRASVLSAELARQREHLTRAILDQTLPGVAACLGGERAAADDAPAAGLTLLESVDLRATLLVTEAVEDIARRTQATWSNVERRLGRVLSSRNDANALAPTVLCYHFRDAIYFDDEAGALRQIDLIAGFSDRFVATLEQLYRELLGTLERFDADAPER